MILTDTSIINGQKTRGEVKRYFDYRSEDETDDPSIKFEIILTNDGDLIAEIYISRNFQNDVKSISIAGRRGQIDNLERSIQIIYPNKKLRKRESELKATDDFLDTEKLIQVTFALLPDGI